MQQSTLKIFGTGQITIPQKWRNLLNTQTIKAFFDEDTQTITLKPVKVIEIEPFTPMTSDDFSAQLKAAGLSDDFIQDATSGFQASSACTD